MEAVARTFTGLDIKIKELCGHKPKLIAIYKLMKSKGFIKFGEAPIDGPSIPNLEHFRSWFVHESGYTYQGYVCDAIKGLPNYKGIYISEDASWIDIGYWKQGKRHGSCIFLTDDGEAWIGERREGAWEFGSRTYFKLDGSQT